MNTTLTNHEMEAVDLARRLTDDKDRGSIFAHEAALVSIIDRLVARVEKLEAELAELRKPVEVLPEEVEKAILAYRRAGQTFDRSEPDISGAGWPRLPGVLVALNNLRSAILKFANERGGGK